MQPIAKQVVNPPTLPPLRGEFFIERFSALSEVEQSLLISRLMSRSPGASMEKAARIFEKENKAQREATFRRLVQNCEPDSVTCFLLEQHEAYFPGLIAAINAAYNGEDLGLLTARGNRAGHEALITAIQDFVGVTFPRRNIYFVNDVTRNGRLAGLSTAEKKLQILRDFASGFYADQQGAIKQMSRRYEKVFFYDDEARNINTVSLFASGAGLSDRIIAVDAPRMSVEDIWHELIEKVKAGVKPEVGRKPVIHFFDIDGTLIKVDANMYLVNRQTGEKLLTISQEELAENPDQSYWIKKAQRIDETVPPELLAMDFGDFGDPERVLRQVQEGKEANRIFKRKGK